MFRTPNLESDQALLDAVRAGDTDAYGRLWSRHAAAIRTAATYFTSYDPDDITAETFTRILRSIERGHGPQHTFRSYALVTARNIAAEWARSHRDLPLEAADELEDPTLAEFSSAIADNRSLAARAFQSLPKRWQEALWYSEVEGMKPAEIAPLLGMKPNSVAALTVRAREGLRQGWVQAHLQEDTVSTTHRWVVQQAAKYTRGKLPAASRHRIDTHLAACSSCRAAYDEVGTANSQLAMMLLPLAIGPAVGAGYLAASTATATPAHAETPSHRVLPRGGLAVIAAASVAAVTICAVALAVAPSAPSHEQAAQPVPSQTPATEHPSGPATASPDPTRTTPAETTDSRTVAPAAPAVPGGNTSVPAPVVNAAPDGTFESVPEVTPAARPSPVPPVVPSAPTPSTTPAPSVSSSSLTPPTVVLEQQDPGFAPRSWGTAKPGAVITATWSTPGRAPLVVTGTATAAGQWSQPAPDLPAGTYQVAVTQQHDGRTSPPVLTTATITAP